MEQSKGRHVFWNKILPRETFCVCRRGVIVFSRADLASVRRNNVFINIPGKQISLFSEKSPPAAVAWSFVRRLINPAARKSLLFKLTLKHKGDGLGVCSSCKTENCYTASFRRNSLGGIKGVGFYEEVTRIKVETVPYRRFTVTNINSCFLFEGPVKT